MMVILNVMIHHVNFLVIRITHMIIHMTLFLTITPEPVATWTLLVTTPLLPCSSVGPLVAVALTFVPRGCDAFLPG